MAKGKVGLGRRGEALAAEVLERNGFTIAERNWHCREGEVDLIARRGRELYFFEVRTRRGERHGTPEQSITPQKLSRMEQVARRYLSELAGMQDLSWHLGFVAVAMSRRGALHRITVYPDVGGEPWEATI